MADSDGTTPQSELPDDTQDEIWPGGGITWGNLSPHGVWGGLGDQHPPFNSLNILMAPEEQADMASTRSDPAIRTNGDSAVFADTRPIPALPVGGSDPMSGTIVCPSPLDITAYKVGGNIGDQGGKLAREGAGVAIMAAPGLAIPGADVPAAAGVAAGGLGVAAGGAASTMGNALQIAAGLDAARQTGDWSMAAAAAAPAIADTVAPLHPLIGSTMDDKLQGILENGNRILQSCRGLGE
jgi:hypothetical protein